MGPGHLCVSLCPEKQGSQDTFGAAKSPVLRNVRERGGAGTSRKFSVTRKEGRKAAYIRL